MIQHIFIRPPKVKRPPTSGLVSPATKRLRVVGGLKDSIWRQYLNITGNFFQYVFRITIFSIPISVNFTK